MSIKATTVSIDTQILPQLLPRIGKAPSTMQTGKDIPKSMTESYEQEQRIDTFHQGNRTKK